jgi:uncharacterized membrane-anchored protein
MTQVLSKHPFIAGIAVAIGCTLVLGQMVMARAAILAQGTQLVLKPQPRDPRDFMRGDYVTFQYSINMADASAYVPSQPKAVKTGNKPVNGKVYVIINPDREGEPKVVKFSHQPLVPGAGQLMLIGRSVDAGSFVANPARSGPSLISFPDLERLYVPEGTGLDLERNQAGLRIVAAVDKAGNAQIRAIERDGKSLFQEPLY